MDGLRYFWIDTCCIKKSDSTELQRSLASMFYWYQRAVRCYVYLADVSGKRTTDLELRTAFGRSMWFERGWTLQELLAPESVEFYSNDGYYLGDKKYLASDISKTTGIPESALKGEDLSRFSVEKRWSWASRRFTTVPEDAAYCMIGIFDVEVHMLYAEGDYNKRKRAAVKKLQRAISETGNDGEQPERVVRIGGASWSDLNTLSRGSLRKLYKDLDEFEQWFVKASGFEGEVGETVDILEKLTKRADSRMLAILEKHGVHYEAISSLGTILKGGGESIKRDQNETATSLDRVRERVEQLHIKSDDGIYRCLTAIRTLEDLRIWSRKWN